MGFHVSDKVDDTTWGIPFFDFITSPQEGRKRYLVFPSKKTVDKGSNAAHNAVEAFRRKVWGLGKAQGLGSPFPAKAWRDAVDRWEFETVPPDKARAHVEDTYNVTAGKYARAVRVAMDKERLKQIRRVMDLQTQKTAPRGERVFTPKKGPGSYCRPKPGEAEWKE